MLIGEKIRKERKVANMSQEEFSEQVGVSLKTVQRWETCERSPRVEQIMQISKVLGLKPEYLLRGMKDEDNSENAEREIIPQNGNIDTNNSVLFFKSGDKEVKLPDTDNNRDLFLQIVREMLTHGAGVPAINSNIKAKDGNYNVNNIAV